MKTSALLSHLTGALTDIHEALKHEPAYGGFVKLTDGRTIQPFGKAHAALTLAAQGGGKPDTPAPAIIGILQAFSSKRDANGNTYHAFSYTDTLTGRTVHGLADGRSNIESIPFYIQGGQWDPRSVFVVAPCEMGRRDFERFTKDFPYYGCTGEEMSRRIRAELAKEDTPPTAA